MEPDPREHPPALTRRAAALALLGVVLGGCGGGGDGGAPFEGSVETRTVSSRITGTDYPLDIYLPPASAGPRSGLPVVYLLDGESWFQTLVDIVEAAHTRVIVVGVRTAGQRNRDFVPPNDCTAGGGGQGAYFDFVRSELIPFVEAAFGGHPARRALFGHSHGGSFVLYAMLSEAPGAHSFSAYLASDASLGCLAGAADGWLAAYAAAFQDLPVRLHLSYASNGNYAANLAYADAITQRAFRGLVWVARVYAGTHTGIVPQVLQDAVAFAVAG